MPEATIPNFVQAISTSTSSQSLSPTTTDPKELSSSTSYLSTSTSPPSSLSRVRASRVTKKSRSGSANNAKPLCSATTNSKPRLTPNQKSDNHKEAENRRRNGIRDQYIILSRLVPTTEGQAKSEEKMLVKTTKHLKKLFEDRRALLAQMEAVGLNTDSLSLSDNEWGGSEWDPKCENEYLKKRSERIAEQGYDEFDDGDDDGSKMDG
jgi:hypothetical protein